MQQIDLDRIMYEWKEFTHRLDAMFCVKWDGHFMLCLFSRGTMKLESISIKRTDNLNEKWVQDIIADDPTILGLGDLIVKDKERMQPNAGRLDLLLQDPESLKRYEVEIQLGSVDESHIIRTIEYWDIEKKRYRSMTTQRLLLPKILRVAFLT